MTLIRNTAEGYTNGTSVSYGTMPANAGAALYVVGASGVFTASSNHPAHGSMGYLAAQPSGDGGALAYLGYSVMSMAASLSLYMPALPPSEENILSFFNSSGNGAVHLDVQANGTVSLYNVNGSTIWTSSAQLAAGTTYRIELQATVATASTGSVQVALYSGDSTTALSGGSFTSSAANFGTAAIANIQYGRAYAFGGNHSYYLDDLSADDGRITFIGPAPAQTPPNLNAGVDQLVEPYVLVTLTATGTPIASGTTISSYAWSQTSGTPTVMLSGSGSSRTFTTPASLAGSTLVFSATCTDSNGTTSLADSVTVTVLPATEFYLATGGAWTPLQVTEL